MEDDIIGLQAKELIGIVAMAVAAIISVITGDPLPSSRTWSVLMMTWKLAGGLFGDYRDQFLMRKPIAILQCSQYRQRLTVTLTIVRRRRFVSRSKPSLNILTCANSIMCRPTYWLRSAPERWASGEMQKILSKSKRQQE